MMVKQYIDDVAFSCLYISPPGEVEGGGANGGGDHKSEWYVSHLIVFCFKSFAYFHPLCQWACHARRLGRGNHFC